MTCDHGEPRVEQLVIGDRAVHDRVFTGGCIDGACEHGHAVRSPRKLALGAPRDQRPAVPPAEFWYRILGEHFLDDVENDLRRLLGILGQVGIELGDTGIAVGEDEAAHRLPALNDRQRTLGNVKAAPYTHGYTPRFEIVS